MMTSRNWRLKYVETISINLKAWIVEEFHVSIFFSE